MKKMFAKITAGIASAAMLCGVGFVSAKVANDNAAQVKAASATLSFNNIGSTLGSTSNTTTSSVDLVASESSTTYTFDYLQGKKQGDAILLAKSTGAYIANKTPMPGDIESVTVFINSGASGKTTYYCSFAASAFTAAGSSGTAVNIAGGASNEYICSTSGAKYFCVSLGNANNGQVLGFTVKYASSSSAVSVTGVSVSPTSKTISTGESFDLTATVTPSDATNKSVTWSTSNSNVATVNNGRVTGVDAGSATITATTVDGSYEASCNVTVTKSYTSIENVYKAAAALDAGEISSETYTFKGTVVGIIYKGYFLQENGYGMYVYRSGASKPSGLKLGNTVEVSATVQKFNSGKIVETKDVASDKIIDSSENVISPTVLSSAADLENAQNYTAISMNGLGKATAKNTMASNTDGIFDVKCGSSSIVINVVSSLFGSQIVEDMQKEGATINVKYGFVYAFNESNQIYIFDENQIEVIAPSVDSVSLDKTELSIEQGASEHLTASASGNVTWTSNTDGVTVSASGTNNVNATISVSDTVAANTSATITATVGTASAVCTITVTEKSTVSSSSVTFNLSIDETKTASVDELTWEKAPISMAFAKGSATSNANNYYPGTSGQSYSSTRAYKNSTITITSATGYTITSVEFTATTSGYATACAGNTWTGATASANETKATIIASSSVSSITATVNGTQGFTSVTVSYNGASQDPVDPSGDTATLSDTNKIYVWSNVTAYQAGVSYNLSNLKNYLNIKTQKLVTAPDASSFITLTAANNVNLGYSPNASSICIGSNKTTSGSLTFTVPNGYYVTKLSGKFINTSDTGTDILHIQYEEFSYSSTDGEVSIVAKPYSNEVSIFTAERRIWVDTLEIEFATATKAADAYATDFNAANICGTNDNTPVIASKWAEQKNIFERADEAVQDAIAMGDLDDENPASVELSSCLNRYDAAVIKSAARGNSSIDDYMKRNGSSNSPAIKSIADDASGVTTIVTVTAIASITLVGGFTLSRKRKHF